jgi:hypothetical protein
MLYEDDAPRVEVGARGWWAETPLKGLRRPRPIGAAQSRVDRLIAQTGRWALGHILGGAISQAYIMLWSSWARLWQCATYGPVNVRNRRDT